MSYVETTFRLLMGAFFLSSGFHKLFVADVHEKMVGLFKKLGCYSVVTEWVIPAGEFLGGAALLLGFLTQVAALGLIVILFGAIYLDCWRADVVAKNPRDYLDWVGKTIYLPEVLMLVILGAIIKMGPDAITFDHVIGFHF